MSEVTGRGEASGCVELDFFSPETNDHYDEVIADVLDQAIPEFSLAPDAALHWSTGITREVAAVPLVFP